MYLSDTFIRNVKPTEKLKKYRDGGEAIPTRKTEWYKAMDICL